MMVTVIIIAAILGFAMLCSGALMLLIGIKVLMQHDDALLHPPDPDHSQWPDEEDEDL